MGNYNYYGQNQAYRKPLQLDVSIDSDGGDPFKSDSNPVSEIKITNVMNISEIFANYMSYVFSDFDSCAMVFNKDVRRYQLMMFFDPGVDKVLTVPGLENCNEEQLKSKGIIRCRAFERVGQSLDDDPLAKINRAFGYERNGEPFYMTQEGKDIIAPLLDPAFYTNVPKGKYMDSTQTQYYFTKEVRDENGKVRRLPTTPELRWNEIAMSQINEMYSPTGIMKKLSYRVPVDPIRLLEFMYNKKVQKTARIKETEYKKDKNSGQTTKQDVIKEVRYNVLDKTYTFRIDTVGYLGNDLRAKNMYENADNKVLKLVRVNNIEFQRQYNEFSRPAENVCVVHPNHRRR